MDEVEGLSVDLYDAVARLFSFLSVRLLHSACKHAHLAMSNRGCCLLLAEALNTLC